MPDNKQELEDKIRREKRLEQERRVKEEMDKHRNNKQ